MSNSALVKHTHISPYSNPRNHKIDKITIHHMAGNLSIEGCGQEFSKASRQASSNYGIGSDGRIGMYVEEKDRSWCSSDRDNDHRAVTIEVANDGGAPDWHVSDKALAALINLCEDICRRNGIEALNFTGDRYGNLTMHRYFIATLCPGPYLASKFQYIADEVNKRLSGKAPAKKSLDTIAQECIAGKWGNGADRKAKLKAAGYDYNEVQDRVNELLAGKKAPAKKPAATKSLDTIAQEVIAGKWGNGDDRKKKLKAAGYDPDAVQVKVNELLGGQKKAPAKKSNKTIAQEVIAGKWGNGDDRKKRLKAAGYDYNAIQALVNKMI